MLIDSHCHLDRVNLKPYGGDFARFMGETQAAGVSHMLCVCIDMEAYPAMRALVDPYPQVSVSAGLHPNERQGREPPLAELVALAADPRNVAIGETGLDYYRSDGDLGWQQQRFRLHIAAAREARKPLIIHSRAAPEDTLRILREEGAQDVGGVMHCFTEPWEVASAAMDLGLYISLSGIVTYAGAEALREVARRLPLERLLIETDSPYLTPLPLRGRPNEPRHVRHVAEAVAQVRGMEMAALVEAIRANFFQLFGGLAGGSPGVG